jgi:hypothetical protein
LLEGNELGWELGLNDGTEGLEETSPVGKLVGPLLGDVVGNLFGYAKAVRSEEK